MALRTRKNLLNGQWMLACCLLLVTISAADVFAGSIRPLPTPETTARSLKKQAAKFVKRGKFDEAEKALQLAIKKEPENVETKLDLAFVHLKQRRLVEAYDLAFPIADADPKNSFAYAIVGSVLLGAGR